MEKVKRVSRTHKTSKEGDKKKEKPKVKPFKDTFIEIRMTKKESDWVKYPVPWFVPTQVVSVGSKDQITRTKNHKGN